MNQTMIIDILDIIVRSFASFVTLFILTRLTGKKTIAQITFFDYVIGISIGSIAAAFAVDNTISYSHGFVSLIVYAIFPIAISYITMNSLKGRRLLGGTPTILVQNGNFIEKNMRKAKFHVNDVLEECRLKGIFNLADVEFAILETNGQVSVQPKSQKQPLTAEDLNIPTQYKGLSANLIIDGKILHEHLKLVNLEEKWLLDELEKQNVQHVKDVLLATLDTSGRLVVDVKNKKIVPLAVLE